MMPPEINQPVRETVPLRTAEYAALRSAIAGRGTARMIVAPAACGLWAALGLWLLASDGPPIGALLSLAPLAAGFEAVHALHAGAERIGRYIQVYYEEWLDGPRWETSAMTVGPALPGGGIDPLFTVLFLAAATVNLLLVLRPVPSWRDLLLLVLVHGLFAFRVIRARTAAARQRAVELESFKALQLRHRERQ